MEIKKCNFNYNDNHRILLFLIVCIPLRFLIVGIAFYLSYKKNPIISSDTIFDKLLSNHFFKGIFYLFTLTIGIGFINTFINNKKIGRFGGKVYWSNLRLVHGINYLLYTYLAINNYKNAFLILLFDVLIGIFGFILNYFL